MLLLSKLITQYVSVDTLFMQQQRSCQLQLWWNDLCVRFDHLITPRPKQVVQSQQRTQVERRWLFRLVLNDVSDDVIWKRLSDQLLSSTKPGEKPQLVEVLKLSRCVSQPITNFWRSTARADHIGSTVSSSCAQTACPWITSSELVCLVECLVLKLTLITGAKPEFVIVINNGK